MNITCLFWVACPCNNDLDVFDRSPLVANFLQGPRSDVNFIVNGTIYECFYLVVHVIYPKWSIFAQMIHEPQREKSQHFAKCQKNAWKDVKCCLGFSKSNFKLLQILVDNGIKK